MSMTQSAPTGIDALRRNQFKTIGASPAKAAGNSIEEFFVAHKGTLNALIQGHIDADRLLKIALGAIRNTPKLRECTVASLFGAVVTCAQIGLEPNTHNQHAWLIPRSKRRQSASGGWIDAWEVQVQIGYQGRIELAYRSPKIALIKSVAVYENDVFVVHEGTDQTIHHEPMITGPRGNLIAVYAIAKMTTGATLFEVMTLADIHKIRDENSDSYVRARDLASTAANDKAKKKALDTPWITDEVEMARKTVIHRLCKSLPTTPEMALASAVEDTRAADFSKVIESGEFSVVDEGGEQASAPDEPALKAPASDLAPKVAEAKTKEPAPATPQSVPPSVAKATAAEPPAEVMPPYMTETPPDEYPAGFGECE